jgi:hypothetical protein
MLSDPAMPGPAHPVVVGVRADDGLLSVAVGRACPAGSTIRLDFDMYAPKAGPTLTFTSSDELTVFQSAFPPASATVTTGLPNNYRWQSAHDLTVNVVFPDGAMGWAGSVDLKPIRDSPAHPAGTYYFGAVGWATPTEIAARDSASLLTVCSPT